jgi:hypothetical protein
MHLVRCRSRALLSLATGLLMLAAGACGGESTSADDEIQSSPGVDEAPLKADEVRLMTELKLMVVPDAIDAARKALKLSEKSADRRDVAFFDTPDLRMYSAGLILRARDGSSGEDDTTVKVRPLAREAVDPEWFGVAGFKCEDDSIGDATVSSCSLTIHQDGGEIRQVLDGERAVQKIFSQDQERFLASCATITYSLDALVALGPVPALKWKVSSRRLGTTFAAELWTLPDGREFLELSIRSASSEAALTLDALRKYLEDKDIPLDPDPESKTRLTLEALAGDAG